MTRIVAGRAGSLTLAVPDAGTRPTSDRVRESLFATLESTDAIADAKVLDLYAGSGALGLEALSRGAQHVDLVERSAKAAGIVERNARRVTHAVDPSATSPRALVHRTAADTFLRATARGPYDLVFVDPPYDVGEDELSATLALLEPALASDAIVVIERSSRSPRPSIVAPLEHGRSRRYGDTTLWWVHRD